VLVPFSPAREQRCEHRYLAAPGCRAANGRKAWACGRLRATQQRRWSRSHRAPGQRFLYGLVDSL